MTTATEAPHVEHEHAHPSDLQYVMIAMFLAVVTGAEVGLYYVNMDFLVYALILGVLMVVKFSTVVMFFMHLRFDSRLFRWVFVTGVTLAVIVYTIVLLTFHVFNGRV
ncbi:MAG TPA: cytochrome C oxidase subunit IV family protein [Acidimicrobiales bacterium]|jgi:cytochrome c oxidase subunit 4